MQKLNIKNRLGFTLIELLVVIAIIGVLAGLAIYFVPSFNTSAKSARGAGDLQQWFNGARQRAIRDQSPHGLRILLGIPIAPSPVGAMESGSTVTITTAAAHGFEIGENVLIAGVGIGGYNGVFTITSVPSPTAFTYTDTTVGLAASGGGFASNGARKCQFLEQPDDLGGGRYWNGTQFTSLTLQTGAPDAQGRYSQLTVNGANFNDGSVQANDYLEINGSGLMHYITGVSGTQLTLGIGLQYPITTPTSNFRILRQPRVVGDEILDLPRNIVVDGTTNVIYSNSMNYPLTAPYIEAIPADGSGNVDIMFSPSGAVMPGTGITKSNVVFWVRSRDFASIFEGEPTLIVVYVQSGLVAAYPVNTGNAANPYDLVK